MLKWCLPIVIVLGLAISARADDSKLQAAATDAATALTRALQRTTAVPVTLKETIEFLRILTDQILPEEGLKLPKQRIVIRLPGHTTVCYRGPFGRTRCQTIDFEIVVEPTIEVYRSESTKISLGP